MKSRRVIIGLIMINIILTGMLCNVICKNKNIIKEAKIIKEMSESTQVTDLNSQINSLNTEHTEYMNYIQSCKTKIATALTNEGVETSNEATLEKMSENISKVLQERTKDATATADDILEGKTAWVNGNLIKGTKKIKEGFYINNETLSITSEACNFSPDMENSYSICTFQDTSTAVNYSGSIRTYGKIDLTNIQKITFKLDYYKTGTGYMYLKIGDSVLWWENAATTVNDYTISANVSSISGEQYIYFYYTSIQANPSDGYSNKYTCSFRTTFKDIIFE